MTDHHAAAISPLLHFTALTKILDKEKALKTPKANIFQRRMCEAEYVLRCLGVPIRILGLKIRQCGGTTISAHIGYHMCKRQNTDGVIIANVFGNSRKILDRIKTFDQHDKFPWNNPLKPSATELTWKNGSQMELTSAETINLGISRTRQFVLFSESCKYPRGGVIDDKDIMANVLHSVPNMPGTCVISESTAGGASGWVYEQWQKALTLDQFIAAMKSGVAAPGNGWVKVFAAWFEFEENCFDGRDGRKSLTEKDRLRIDATLESREANGIKLYGWTHEQIAWRRHMIESECGGSMDLFDQNFPEDDVSCFLSSGRPRFNMGAVTRMEKRIQSFPAPEEGTLDLQGNGEVVFARDSGGFAPFLVWERPKVGARYLISVDPATGEDFTEGNSPDHHSVLLWRGAYTQDRIIQKIMMVARIRAPCTCAGPILGERIAALSKLYGDCIVAPEQNLGMAIIERLEEMGVPIIRREVMDPFDRDAPPKYMLGYRLKDREVRRQVIDCLALLIHEDALDVRCPNFIQQCKTFIVDKNGKEIARSGSKDDDIMSGSIGCHCVGSGTLYSGETRRRRRPSDWRQWRKM